MPFNKKEWMRQYRLKNKEKTPYKERKAYYKQHYIDNKEKIKKSTKQYHIDNPKVSIISCWKKRGVIDNDYDLLYDYFITQTNCWICNKEYNNYNRMDRRCLDHDHTITDDGNVRYICCAYCNIHIVK